MNYNSLGSFPPDDDPPLRFHPSFEQLWQKFPLHKTHFGGNLALRPVAVQ